MADKEIGTKLVLLGEKEFNAQMRAINSTLKTTKSDMAAVSAEFYENANSIDSLTAKQKSLQENVEQHRAKVNFLAEQYEAASTSIGKNSARTEDLRRQLNFAREALAKQEQALKKNTAALESAQKANGRYTPITQRMADATKDAGNKVKKMAADIADGAHHVPVLAEALDMAKLSAKGLGIAAKGTESVIKGLGTAAGGIAKGVGAISGASAKAAAAGIAAISTGSVFAVTQLAWMAREAAEAAKAASEAGEELTASQQQWLAYSNQLDALDASVAGAKSALAGILLPMLGDLSTEGAAFLDDFSRDMEAAAGDTGKQTQVLSNYIVKGATLIKEKLPEYIESGKELFSGLTEGRSEAGPELTEMGLDLVMDLLDQIIAYAPELAEAGTQLIEQLLQGLIERGPDVTANAADMVTKIVTGLAGAAPQIIPAATLLVTQLILTLIEAAPQLGEAGLELVLGIILGIIGGIGQLVGASEETIAAVQQSFRDAFDSFMTIGGEIVQAIKTGISNAWDGVRSWFSGLVSGLTANVTVKTDGSHAGGLRYVPFDGYIAELHKGELVMPRAEADRYRRGVQMGTNAVQKVFNLTIQTTSLSPAEVDMLIAYMNEKLGGDLP